MSTFRRLLARIHRLTVGSLRKQIEPVTAAQFMRWLLRWQHVADGTQVLGERGTLDVLRQLQGFEIPANAWERQVLARRIANYDPAVLDQLCMTGAVGWGRLSPHPATLMDSADGKRRVIPTSVAPITFFVREDSDWMTPRHPGTDLPESRGLSPGAREVLDFLRHRGASFFTDIVRGTGPAHIGGRSLERHRPRGLRQWLHARRRRRHGVADQVASRPDLRDGLADQADRIRTARRAAEDGRGLGGDLHGSRNGSIGLDPT